jgi:predicted enzyme related to lactoylglutathione lyase
MSEDSIERAHNFVWITIPVSDVEQSFRFYVDRLGFEDISMFLIRTGIK